MDDQFIQREEEEQGKEFEEEAEEDYDYLDDDLEKMELMVNKPMVTSWCHSDGITWEEVLISNWPILGRSKNKSVLSDACPICFKALTGGGKHQIQHGKMIFESVEHGPLLWPSVTEDGVKRLKKYSELSSAEATQADCDVKATNIIL
uniref:Zinc finger, RING/FYVE/PHD-type n=1 Tax=Tanacetum cinerariifolium TaxID=118510 RepID=A0A699IDD6_TANCI|nr:zinc finger, RING/FYVE/PHD-type [Tanacetum cinerariifolium]